MDGARSILTPLSTLGVPVHTGGHTQCVGQSSNLGNEEGRPHSRPAVPAPCVWETRSLQGPRPEPGEPGLLAGGQGP